MPLIEINEVSKIFVYSAEILNVHEYLKKHSTIRKEILKNIAPRLRLHNIEIKVDDILVVPEYFSNALQQLSNIRCIKVMLVQQKEYIFETLPIGSRWSDYGFDRIITTTEAWLSLACCVG